MPSLTTGAQQKLLYYSYPGNVRELRSMIELAVVMSENNVIDENEIVLETGLNLSNLLGEEITMKEYEQRVIEYFLKKYDNNVLLVAQKLDIGKSTIYRMLREKQQS